MIADCIYAHLCIFYYSKVHAAFQGVLSPLAKFFCGRCEKGTPSREQSHGAYNVIRRSAATAQRRISYHTRSDMCNSCCQSCCGCQGSLASALANLFDTGCDCSCNNFSCYNCGRNRSSGNCGCNNASAISNGNRSGCSGCGNSCSGQNRSGCWNSCNSCNGWNRSGCWNSCNSCNGWNRSGCWNSCNSCNGWNRSGCGCSDGGFGLNTGGFGSCSSCNACSDAYYARQYALTYCCFCE